MNSCKSCKYAVKACNSEYVGCLYWEKKRQLTECSYSDIMDKLSIERIYTGWVEYPNGILFNHYICFPTDFVCEKLEISLYKENTV